MNTQNFLRDPNTNWKYIAIVVILAFLVGGGILGYCYWWLPRQEVEIPEIETPEKKPKDETADWRAYRNEEYKITGSLMTDFFSQKIFDQILSTFSFLD